MSNLQSRYLKKDKLGNEWMTSAQYHRAVQKDFNITASRTIISYGMTSGKIPKECISTVHGKKVINYTASVIFLLDQSPNITPDNFDELKRNFITDSIYNTAPFSSSVMPDVIITDDDNDDDKKETDVDISITHERALLTRVNRKKAELELAVLDGTYMHIEEVARALTIIAVETRQATKAIIPRCSKILAGLTDVHEIKNELNRELDIALNKLNLLDALLDGSYEDKVSKDREEEEE